MREKKRNVTNLCPPHLRRIRAGVVCVVCLSVGVLESEPDGCARCVCVCGGVWPLD